MKQSSSSPLSRFAAPLFAILALWAGGCQLPSEDYEPELGFNWRPERVGKIQDGRYIDPNARLSYLLPAPDSELYMTTNFAGDRQQGWIRFAKRNDSITRIDISIARNTEELDTLADPQRFLAELAVGEEQLLQRRFPKLKSVFDSALVIGERPVHFSCYIIPNSPSVPDNYHGVFFLTDRDAVYIISRDFRSGKSPEQVLPVMRSDLEEVLGRMEFLPPPLTIFNMGNAN